MAAEAISSLKSCMRSFLRPNPADDREEDKPARAKWQKRLEDYEKLLADFGGKIRGERTSYEELGS